LLYAAHGDSGEVSAHAIDKSTGKLRALNRQPTQGDNSPHVTIDPTGRFVVVANGPGIAVYPIVQDGTLAPASEVLVPPGEPGPYHREQGHGAHPHQVLFDPGGRFLVAPDKGVDRVHVYRLDTASGKLVANDPPAVKSRYGAGPRHIAFHPTQPYAYLINELDSTVTTYEWDATRGRLTPRQVITTLPTTYTGDNTGAEIAVAPSGRFVYGSNRGHDSIVVFSVDQANGTLEPVQWEATQGKRPRFFALDPAGNQLLVANQDTNTIVVFRIDQATGKLSATGQIVETGTPSCIVFSAF
jgi:6-phosphogluconolactonase